MNRTTLIISIMLLGAVDAGAGTFNPTPYLSDAGVDALTRGVANSEFGRDLFSDPYATVVVGNVDVYDRFPYLEAHYFQIVSDPTWNRLLMGEVGQAPVAFDGDGTSFGPLDAPHGMSTDGRGRVYVADTGNDRVLVFQALSEFDHLELKPLYAVTGLAKPFAVAFSDGGTPFDAGDDLLYVANTGRNEVRRYALSDGGARLTTAIGDLGSGVGRFAGPMAIAVGRHDGANDDDVYVADAHNARMVHLKDTGASLAWLGAVSHGLGLVTSLDTDQWGNVYAAAPQTGRVAKFNPTLFPVADFASGVQHPRDFHVVFANVTDHRDGSRTRSGQGSGVLVDDWNGNSGIRLLDLGVDLKDAAAVEDDNAAVGVTITDHAHVTAEISDPHTGAVIARHDAGSLAAGLQTIRFTAADYVAPWSEGEYRVTVRAASSYDEHQTAQVETPIVLKTSGNAPSVDHLTLLGNVPNPFNPITSIRFVVPAGPGRAYSVRVYDVRGAFVRELASGQIGGGAHEVRWDGRDAHGAPVSSGIYLYRVEAGREALTGKMALLK
jgi:FlgD Ig-like domain/NHL repeat